MQSIVTIKGKEDGLEIYLDEKSTYPVLREELMVKLKKNKEFFRDSDTKVVIRGKQISDAQCKEIKRVFAMDFGIRDVLFGDEADMMREAELKIERPAPSHGKAKSVARPKDEYLDEVDLVSNSYFDAQSIFINNTIRSGQRIECEGDIVVIGGVNPGAEVIAGGSIAVFGRLSGLAHAGCSGRTDVCVAALNMCPKQLRLSGRVVTFPNEREDVEDAEIAELKDGKVVIRPVSLR
ncbi:MAG: septum site-determining protein MinC [Christensenella sp.]|uniref:septum site-determining protein MinC n=1 Tax=Christensenella sp. TaxID=1935934 RepID=UPI002B2113B7|nr:septum site-determining protein MinC [Christensenella sp.]MEA5002361.1 septum site-determining protein MinC [Christensenella sp.]